MVKTAINNDKSGQLCPGGSKDDRESAGRGQRSRSHSTSLDGRKGMGGWGDVNDIREGTGRQESEVTPKR